MNRGGKLNVASRRKPQEQVRDAFFEMVRSLPPGITEIVFHPALDSDALKRITNSWRQRTWEGQLFADPAVHELFQAEAIQFTDWREMMRRHKALRSAAAELLHEE